MRWLCLERLCVIEFANNGLAYGTVEYSTLTVIVVARAIRHRHVSAELLNWVSVITFMLFSICAVNF